MFSHEEDGVRVYRRRGERMPPSRRPRDGFDLEEDGTSRRLEPGPGDAPVAVRGTWEMAGDRVILHEDAGDRALEIVDAGADELRVRPE